jgi:SAM-dependent methyltransferase
MANHVAKNRAQWNRSADAYQASHGPQLEAKQNALAWGAWSIPERELRALGEVRGRDALEFGCGGAQWSVSLARAGARVIGLDLSERQLVHARRFVKRSGVEVPLVQASAEAVPFADASFDLVFCDHGAMSFADPARTVPEAARVLREGGRFAFNTSSPIRYVCWDPVADRVDERLHGDYFGLDAIDDDDAVTFQRTYGAWVRLFRARQLAIEDLIEPRPAADASTSYEGYAPLAWARRWPTDALWVLTKDVSA